MKFNWKIGGEAGFGIMTSGLTFAKIATRSGYHMFDYTEYPSLIRGGHNTYEVAFSDEQIHSSIWHVDLLVCLNKDSYELHKHRLSEKSMVIYDPELFEIDLDVIKVVVPFNQIKKDEKIQQQMVNTIAVGASIALMGGDMALLDEMLHEAFDRKGEDVVNFNLRLAQLGQESIAKSGIAPLDVLKRKADASKKLVITGNEMFSLASIPADCRQYISYPMTPASSVLSILAAWQYKNGMVVRHPEDEISAINAALGSSYAGARSSVGTSGGGFALMVESLSYAGVAEIPIVVFLSMRPGPATGLPTWTEQGDLLFAVHAGHGEFPKIVLAPGDIEEMATLTLEAYNLADIYQTPVIILSDKYLSESHKDVEKSDIDREFSEYVVERGKIVHDTSMNPYLRYKDAEDGISEMLLPGKSDVFYQANSYEHIEDSHTTESDTERVTQVDKRNRKTQTYLKNHFKMPQIFGNLETAEVVLVTWGSMKGPALDSMSLLDPDKTALIHFTHLYPLDEKKIQELSSKVAEKRVILIENNSHAQFSQLLRQQTGITVKETLLKYDGRPFWPEEIRDYVLGKRESAETSVLAKLEEQM
ncbi:2-oxoacid:acceptor oxidoreductase subunit alpha [Candidatus Woesebacteria bacterium]|nr:2-oxoacid:acceptor oxidoreductase subunit alpha [Candidatus Woesebacteria bacterium]